MTNENTGNNPPADTNAQSAPQPPVAPPTPLQSALPNDSKGNADEEEAETKELAREFRIAEKWIIGTNIVLAIIGIFALCINNGQLKVMRGQLGEIIRQYPEIQKSADAAETSADFLKFQTRPWVSHITDPISLAQAISTDYQTRKAYN